jgi:flagellar biosynthesis/type III secretory pathway protein FliH
MTHEKYTEQYLGQIDARVIMVMLCNFTKNEYELVSVLDKWLFAFKEKELETVTKGIPTYKKIDNIANTTESEGEKESGLSAFYHILDKKKFATSHLKKYEENLAVVNNVLSDIYEEGRKFGKVEGFEFGRKEGIELGRKEGIEFGRKEGIEFGRKEGIELGRKEGIELGRKEGIELGRKEGIELGRKERIRMIVISLLESGMDVNSVCKMTKLSNEEVESIKKTMS